MLVSHTGQRLFSYLDSWLNMYLELALLHVSAYYIMTVDISPCDLTQSNNSFLPNSSSLGYRCPCCLLILSNWFLRPSNGLPTCLAEDLFLQLGIRAWAGRECCLFVRKKGRFFNCRDSQAQIYRQCVKLVYDYAMLIYKEVCACWCTYYTRRHVLIAHWPKSVFHKLF